MTREELLSDLAYARTLAEEGRHAPLIGGAYLVMFGVLLAICYTAQWTIIEGLVPLAPSMVGAIWMTFGVCALLGNMLLSRRVRSLPGGATVSNRIDRNVWFGVMWAILAVVAGSILRALRVEDFAGPDVIMAAAFGLYGVALYATATAGGHAWLRTFAILAWCMSGILWFFLGEPWLYLIAAAASVTVLIVPGVIMMRREPKSVT